MGVARVVVRWFLVAGLLTAGSLVGLAVLGVISLPGVKFLHSDKTVQGKENQPAEPDPVVVTTSRVTQRPVKRTVELVGSFHGQEEVTVTPKVEGRVQKILHDIGDVVKPGDILLEIEEIDFLLAKAEATRALEMELAKIGLTELPPGDFDVRKVPTVVRAEALERGATTRFERVQRAHAARATSPEDFDQALTELNMAQAATRQTIMDARATLAAARHKKALLETAEQRLRYTRVQAPNPSQERIGPTQKVEYVVSQRLVSEGEMVRAFPSVPVFKLVIDRPLKFLSTVPERHVGEVKLGQTADIGVEAYPGKTFPGRVSRVNPTVDRANRTFQIEILVENESRALKAGSFAKASLFTHEDPKALTVPDEALVFFAGVTKVFIVRQGKAHAVEVKRGVPLEIKIPVEGTNKPGDNQDDTKRPRAFVWWEVEPLGELPAGSPVITSGQSQLAEGTPVRVRP